MQGDRQLQYLISVPVSIDVSAALETAIQIERLLKEVKLIIKMVEESQVAEQKACHSQPHSEGPDHSLAGLLGRARSLVSKVLDHCQN